MAATTIHLREVCRQTLVDFSAVPAYAGPFLRTPFKPCVQFSRTRLNDDLTGVACAGDFTVARGRCQPQPHQPILGPLLRSTRPLPAAPNHPVREPRIHIAVELIELPVGISRPEV